MEQLIGIALMLTIGYIFGAWLEKRHFKYILKCEKNLAHKPAVNLKRMPLEGRDVTYARLVVGSTVVSVDYAKRFMVGFRLIFGGRLKSYESLLDRARREAILRMKESHMDADMYMNIRIETSSISKGRNEKSVGSIEAIAYATAIKFGS